ncbi:hypothetical protein FOA52_004716 [Chlamydomonas sp. UWO 241]|nr:hypothetical protein FOA52_004716 [Chlamydomonas sp. UWO 241]
MLASWKPCGPSCSGQQHHARSWPPVIARPCTVRVASSRRQPTAAHHSSSRSSSRAATQLSSLGAGSPPQNSGQLGRASAKALAKALSTSRARLATAVNAAPPLARPATPSSPKTASSSSVPRPPQPVLEAEFQALVSQLRQLGTLEAPPRPVAPSSPAQPHSPAAVRDAQQQAAAASVIDASLPEFAPRPLGDVAAQVLVCQGKKCAGRGALGVLQAASAASSGSPRVDVLPCKCLGSCRGTGAAVRIKGPRGDVLLTGLGPLDVGDVLTDQLAPPRPTPPTSQQQA